MKAIPRNQWKWFGYAGHFIGGQDCRFHLCTQIGDVLISTVGAYFPPSQDTGPVPIGADRTYETFVFRAGAPCDTDGCGCGQPTIDGREIDSEGYNDGAAATAGHLAMCDRWARRATEAA